MSTFGKSLFSSAQKWDFGCQKLKMEYEFVLCVYHCWMDFKLTALGPFLFHASGISQTSWLSLFLGKVQNKKKKKNLTNVSFMCWMEVVKC